MNEPSPQPKEAPTVAPSTPQRATQPAPQFIERVTHRLGEWFQTRRTPYRSARVEWDGSDIVVRLSFEDAEQLVGSMAAADGGGRPVSSAVDRTFVPRPKSSKRGAA